MTARNALKLDALAWILYHAVSFLFIYKDENGSLKHDGERLKFFHELGWIVNIGMI